MNKPSDIFTKIIRKAILSFSAFTLMFGTFCLADDLKFYGDSGVIVPSATLSRTDTGQAQIKLKIKNNTTKRIEALKFYVLCYDVYGDEITSFMGGNQLFTDEGIGWKETETRTWILQDKSIKRVTLYLYSVYFEDETEWGDRKAKRKDIITKGECIHVLKK